MTMGGARPASHQAPQRRSLHFDYRCTPEVKSKLSDLVHYENQNGTQIQSDADLLEHFVREPLGIEQRPDRLVGRGHFKGGRTVHDHLRISPQVMDLFRQRLVDARRKSPSVRTLADLLEEWVLIAWDRVFMQGGDS